MASLWPALGCREHRDGESTSSSETSKTWYCVMSIFFRLNKQLQREIVIHSFWHMYFILTSRQNPYCFLKDKGIIRPPKSEGRLCAVLLKVSLLVIWIEALQLLAVVWWCGLGGHPKQRKSGREGTYEINIFSNPYFSTYFLHWLCYSNS